MLIRPAHISDLGSIQSCAKEAFEPYVETIGKAPAPMESDFPNQISAGDLHVALNRQGELVGYIVFSPRGDYMELEAVAIAKSVQGQGLGKRLIRFCEDSARRQNLLGVRLYTNEKMTGNLTFYPHLGYQESDRRFDQGFSRVFFQKTF